MKITQRQLMNLVKEEIEKLDPKLQEGVLDYLKGAGQNAGGKMANTRKING